MREPKIIVPPTSEPVTAAQSWAHLRVTLVGSPPAPSDADDIAEKLSQAREWAEKYTGRAIAPQTLELALDEFPNRVNGVAVTQMVQNPRNYPIRIPRFPTSITSVSYLDSAGIEQVMDPSLYRFDNYVDPPVLLPAPDTAWPATKVEINAVKIRYPAGYTAPADSPQDAPVPPLVRAGILLILGDLYELRENSSVVTLGEIPLSAKNCLKTFRIENGFA